MSENWSIDQYRNYLKGLGYGPKPSKYGNKPMVVDGIRFASIAEAERYNELKLLVLSGEIQGFGRQPSFIITTGGTRYMPDFIVCDNDGSIWVEDVKGHETQQFKLKKREWEAVYPWLPLKLIKKGHGA